MAKTENSKSFHAPAGYSRLTINLKNDVHKKIKTMAIELGTTVTNLITKLLENDLDLKDWIEIAEDSTEKLGETSKKLNEMSNQYEQTRDELVKAEKTIESLIYQRAHLIALINILTKGK